MTEWAPLIPHIIHDVRALVRQGMASSQLLEHKLGADADPEVARWLSSMISSQRELNLLMMRLGALAQAGRSPSIGRDEPLDLDAALLGAKLRCRDALEQSSAELSIGPLPNCKVPARLELVWTELISNSCRFRDPSRGLKIRVEASCNPDILWVSLADNGTGWSPAFAPMLFQPLQRSNPERGGLGLGLAIARATVESAGGEIRAELGSPGACFHVSIPAACDA